MKLNSLPYEHIRQPTKTILKYIDDRRKGITKSLRTSWIKFNKQCMGGIEPNTIYTIAGISGSGKSAFANTLETDLVELNLDENFVVLSFTFEMLNSKQVGRKLSRALNKTVTELYSGDTNDTNARFSDDDYNQAVEQAKKIERYPIYYVDCPGTVEEIRNTVFEFYEKVAKGKWLIIMLDHTLLVKGRNGDDERRVIVDLQRMFMEIKKYGRNTIIQLSQMNREIEDKERINNPILHYPVRRDLSTSDSLFQASDYVIVLHRPELLNISAYGVKFLKVKNKVYMHFLKCREGEPKILEFDNELKYNRIKESNDYKI